MSTATTETLFRRIRRVIRQAINGEEQNFTTGSIDRAIVLLAIPMMLEMAMESMFAVVDAFFVARISVQAVATVGLTESVLMLVYSIAIGLSSAATAMVARRIGEGDPKAASRAGAQIILIGLGISVLIAVPGYFFAEDILRLMSSDPALVANGKNFTRLMFTANLPILFLWMLNGIFRGAGDAATAMRALWLANGVNIVLCPLLIFGWGPVPAMGLIGSGIATTIGRSVGVGYQLWHLFGVGKILQLHLAYLRPDREIISRQLILAAGSTGQFLIASASWIFLASILGQIGTSVTAGYTIAMRLVVFAILPSWGMANAAATLVGQNLGAGQPERAERSAWRAGHINFIFMAVVAILYLSTAPYLIRFFTQDPDAVAAGSLALRIIAGGYVFYGYGMILLQAINGAGDTRTPTILNFICFWLLQVPLAWLLSLHLGWGQTGVYSVIVIAESCLALGAMWIFRRGRWKLAKV